MNRRNTIIVVVLLVLVGALAVYSGNVSLGVKPTPTPVAMEEDLDYLVTASGTLLPESRANLAFKTAGQAAQVAVKQGDRVKKGDVLVRLEAVEMQAGAAAAEAKLNALKAGPTKEEVAVAQANLDTAKAQASKVRAGPTAEQIAIAKATLDRARAGLKDAQAEYDKVRDDPAVGMFPQSRALQAAYQEYQIAEATYNQVLKGATPEDIRIAESNVAAAQAAYDQVKAGARSEEIAAAQALLDQAKATLNAATLTAPFDGTVALVSVREGESVAPGAAVITLGDVSRLRLETDDLSETSIARVRTGQPANVTFEALPGQTFQGKVTAIAPIASAKQGGTNYTVTVEFDQLDPALRWGMTGHVEIDSRR